MFGKYSSGSWFETHRYSWLGPLTVPWTLELMSEVGIVGVGSSDGWSAGSSRQWLWSEHFRAEEVSVASISGQSIALVSIPLTATLGELSSMKATWHGDEDTIDTVIPWHRSNVELPWPRWTERKDSTGRGHTQTSAATVATRLDQQVDRISSSQSPLSRCSFFSQGDFTKLSNTQCIAELCHPCANCSEAASSATPVSCALSQCLKNSWELSHSVGPNTGQTHNRIARSFKIVKIVKNLIKFIFHVNKCCLKCGTQFKNKRMISHNSGLAYLDRIMSWRVTENTWLTLTPGLADNKLDLILVRNANFFASEKFEGPMEGSAWNQSCPTCSMIDMTCHDGLTV